MHCFFYDRTAFPGVSTKSDWCKKHFPLPLSEIFIQSRVNKKLTDFEQESGLIVINKKERLLGLLSVCNLLTQGTKEFYSQTFGGEKESWWVGFEIGGESYTFNGVGAGALGELHTKDGKQQCCGHILTFDRKGAPLYVNGAFRGDSTTKSYTHYSYDGEWDFVPRCTSVNITALNERELKVLEDTKKFYPTSIKVE